MTDYNSNNIYYFYTLSIIIKQKIKNKMEKMFNSSILVILKINFLITL